MISRGEPAEGCLDFILEISFDAADGAMEELIQSRLYLTPSQGSTSTEAHGTTTISVWFDSTEERRTAHEAFAALDGVALRDADRARVDWLEHYQQSLQPLFIGRRFVVVPDLELLPAESDLLTIIVPQEQAFGTGSHETTSLCIEILESLDVAREKGLDIGAGSGILALAMLRLGARKAVAFDNDPDAYAALRDNRERNGVPAESMPLFLGSVEALRGGTFDVMTMNIIPEVILPLLPEVTPRLAADGRLILSGILVVRRNDVVAAASRQGLTLVSERERGEWWAGVFRIAN